MDIWWYVQTWNKYTYIIMEKNIRLVKDDVILTLSCFIISVSSGLFCYCIKMSSWSIILKTLQWRHNGQDEPFSGANQRKHVSSASLSFVRGFHRRPMNSPHRWPVKWLVTRKMFPFEDVIMRSQWSRKLVPCFPHRQVGYYPFGIVSKW